MTTDRVGRRALMEGAVYTANRGPRGAEGALNVTGWRAEATRPKLVACACQRH